MHEYYGFISSLHCQYRIYLYNKYLVNTSYVKIQERGKSDTVCLAFLLLRPIS